MTVIDARRWLLVTTMMLCAAAVAAVAWGLFASYTLPAPDGTAVPAPATRPAATLPVLSAAAFEPLMDLDLRRPLLDAPPPATAATAGVAPLNLRLTGIVLEPDHSFAVFTTPAGTTEVKGVGGRAGGAEVLRIDPAAVTVRYNGQTTVLRLPARGTPG